jgi:hypothetical protein
VIVHIFMDVGRLAHDLSSANLLPEPDQLWTFIQGASKHEPGLTISDCGAGSQAVHAKMKHFYELYLENCHCRHLFVALGRESEYYQELSNWADDPVTKKKTTLLEPAQGLPPMCNLPFHTARFSCLDSVRRQTVAFQDTVASVNGTGRHTNGVAAPPPTVPATSTRQETHKPSPGSKQHDPSTLSATAPKFSPARANGSVEASAKKNGILTHIAPRSPEKAVDGAVHGNHRNVKPSSSNSQPSAASTSEPPASSSRSSIEPMSQQASASMPAQPLSGVEESKEEVFKLDTSSHSSHQSNTAEQKWEVESVNSYLPAPIEVPWGEEVLPPTPQPSQEAQPIKPRASNENQRRFKANGNSNGGSSGPRFDRSRPSDQPLRSGPKQFDGSWDEMVETESRKGSTQGSSSPSKTSVKPAPASSKSTDFNNPFTRQVAIKPEPSPLGRPVIAPISLNQFNQRIDLKLPRPSHEDEVAFHQRVKNRHLCNEHHMRGKCTDVRCGFDHEEISDGIYLTLRNKARQSPCKQGSECRRHDCYLGHHCGNVTLLTTCGRPKCPFGARKLHDVEDLEVVKSIEPTNNQAALLEGLL